MAAANGDPAPCPMWLTAQARCDGELEITTSSSDTEYGREDSCASAKSPSSASASAVRLSGCTRAMTNGTSSPGPAAAMENTTSSPSSELTDCTRSTIRLNSSPASEVHQVRN